MEARPEGHDRVPNAEKLDFNGVIGFAGTTPVRGRHLVGPAGAAGGDVVEKEERSEVGIGFRRDPPNQSRKWAQRARLGGPLLNPKTKT